jgi:hypothetical protein
MAAAPTPVGSGVVGAMNCRHFVTCRPGAFNSSCVRVAAYESLWVDSPDGLAGSAGSASTSI